MIVENADNPKHHCLRSMSIVGGFLDGVRLDFTEGLNCLIGHRGTGKTTVLEFIRYALDEFPRDDGQACRKRIEALVKSNLGDGRIRLTVRTKDGLDYIVDRTAGGEAMVLTSDGQPTDVRIDSGGLFGADIFSQNEVENIADSPQSQLALIDNFAAESIAALNRQIDAVRAGLVANAQSILPARQTVDRLADAISTRGAIEAKIAALADAPGTQNADEVNRAHKHSALRGREDRALRECRDLLGEYRAWLEDGVGRFAGRAEELFEDEMLCGPNGPLMTPLLASMRQFGETLDALMRQGASAAETHLERVDSLASQLQREHQKQELAFRDLIGRHQQDRAIATERTEWENKRNDLLAKQRRHDDIRRQLDDLYRRRQELAGELRALQDKRFELRRQVADWISAEVASPVRVQVDQCGDTTGYQALLASCLKGSVVQYNTAARKIAQFIPPAELLRIVAAGDLDEIKGQSELGDGQAPKVMEALKRTEVQLQLDMVELADLPRIELQDGQDWKNSLRLSTGQKCTSILPILLLDSDSPLMIDQPEDNLDNRFIFDTVVEAIHRVKPRRQIVLITHNPNIPVLGDASCIHVLTSDGQRAAVANRGSVDHCKTEIINLLEGGQEAFLRRKDRYNY